jgi:hypothetical protein
LATPRRTVMCLILSITDSIVQYSTVPPGKLYVCFHVCNSSVIMCATILLLDGDKFIKNS